MDEYKIKLIETISMLLDKSERPDSITFGTPGKGGEVKVYFDASKPEEAKKLLENAIELRKYAGDKIR